MKPKCLVLQKSLSFSKQQIFIFWVLDTKDFYCFIWSNYFKRKHYCNWCFWSKRNVENGKLGLIIEKFWRRIYEGMKSTYQSWIFLSIKDLKEYKMPFNLENSVNKIMEIINEIKPLNRRLRWLSRFFNQQNLLNHESFYTFCRDVRKTIIQKDFYRESGNGFLQVKFRQNASILICIMFIFWESVNNILKINFRIFGDLCHHQIKYGFQIYPETLNWWEVSISRTLGAVIINPKAKLAKIAILHKIARFTRPIVEKWRRPWRWKWSLDWTKCSCCGKIKIGKIM